MKYTVQQLAKRAGISVRTLHYYYENIEKGFTIFMRGAMAYYADEHRK